ncbi:MAG: hypothetical protein ACTS7I_02880 [Candidatus Hodgkinia cicadicola]
MPSCSKEFIRVTSDSWKELGEMIRKLGTERLRSEVRSLDPSAGWGTGSKGNEKDEVEDVRSTWAKKRRKGLLRSTWKRTELRSERLTFGNGGRIDFKRLMLRLQSCLTRSFESLYSFPMARNVHFGLQQRSMSIRRSRGVERYKP